MTKFCHIVILKFKTETTEETIQSIFNALRALHEEKIIPGLMSFSGGTYSSPEGLNKGFTHAFTMIFENESSRDNYFPHVDHVRVKDMIIPTVDDVVAFDYAL